MKTTRFFIIFLVLSTVIFLRWFFFYEQSLTGIDDANIYFVYAKNLAEGNGFVYNVGGERVEGFTSFLWVMILTLFYLLGPMEILTLFLNLLIITYTLFRLTSFTDSLANSSPSRPIGTSGWFLLAFICLIPGYLDWTILTLMETGLWSSLLVLISLNLLTLFLEPQNKAADKRLLYLIPLLVLTRPESIAWGIIFILIRLGQYLYLGNSPLKAVRKSLPVFAVYFASLMLLIIFRLGYFGYPFPNTYYVKVSSDFVSNFIAGAYYLSAYIKGNPFILLFLLLLLVSFLFIVRELYQRKGRLQPVSMLQLSILSIVGIQFLIPFYTGGDHFHLSRFYQPLYPLLLVGVFNSRFWRAHILLKRKGLTPVQVALTGITLCFLILGVTKFSLFETSPIKKEFDIAHYGRENGQQLNKLFRKSAQFPTVATYIAGGLAYTYKGNTLDVLGLNNTLIAHWPKDSGNGIQIKNHSAFSKGAFYQLLPDIIHMDFINELDEAILNEQDSSDFQNQVYKYIFLDEDFRSKYVPVAIAVPESNNWYLAYVKTQYLDKLRKEKFNFSVFNPKEGKNPVQEDAQLQLSIHKD